MRDYYAASDRHLSAARGRTVAGDRAAGYVPRCRLRLELPAELLDGSLTYERALAEYFRDLLAAHEGDASRIWSIDGVHFDYLSAARK